MLTIYFFFHIEIIIQINHDQTGNNINEHYNNSQSTTIGMDSFPDCISVQHGGGVGGGNGVTSRRRGRKNSEEREQVCFLLV